MPISFKFITEDRENEKIRSFVSGFVCAQLGFVLVTSVFAYTGKISEILGVPIEWDGPTKSVLIYPTTAAADTPAESPSISQPAQSNQPSAAQQPQNITTVDALASYLNTSLGPIKTAIGTYSYSIKITENTSSNFPQDFAIYTEFVGGTPWYDLQYSISYTDEQKAAAIQTLRDFQQNIYAIASLYFPNKKMTGCYYNSYYKYPNIYKGYVSTRVMTWKNYSGDILTDYSGSSITSFHWYANSDDYIFN